MSEIEELRRMVHELMDKEAIREQLHNYARAMDRCDLELGVKVFHPDAVLEYGFPIKDVRSFMEGCFKAHLSWPGHSHQMSTISIWFDGPDKARSEVYGDCTLRRVAEDGSIFDNRRLVRYIDQWVRVEDGWQIVKRVVADDMNEVFTSEDSAGMKSGRRDRTDASYFPDLPPPAPRS